MMIEFIVWLFWYINLLASAEYLKESERKEVEKGKLKIKKDIKKVKKDKEGNKNKWL